MTDTTALYASLIPGNQYGGFGWGLGPDRKGVGFAFIWSDGATERTGRSPSDLFGMPRQTVAFKTKVRVGDGPFIGIPTVSYLREDAGAEDRVFAAVSDPDGEPDDGATHGLLILDAVARRAEAVVRRVWDELIDEKDGDLMLIRSVLMVLAAETEPRVIPRTTKQPHPDGTEMEIEWYGVTMLRSDLRYLWERIVSGAPAEDVLERYDEITTRYPVPPPLAAAQRAALAHCLSEHDDAIPEARRAEQDWRQAEVEMERLRAGAGAGIVEIKPEAGSPSEGSRWTHLNFARRVVQRYHAWPEGVRRSWTKAHDAEDKAQEGTGGTPFSSTRSFENSTSRKKAEAEYWAGRR